MASFISLHKPFGILKTPIAKTEIDCIIAFKRISFSPMNKNFSFQPLSLSKPKLDTSTRHSTKLTARLLVVAFAYLYTCFSAFSFSVAY
jgi:hypothetical protein